MGACGSQLTVYFHSPVYFHSKCATVLPIKPEKDTHQPSHDRVDII